MMGLSHQEQWKVLERGNGSETRDGGGERLEETGSQRLCAGDKGAIRTEQGFTGQMSLGQSPEFRDRLNKGIRGGGRAGGHAIAVF